MYKITIPLLGLAALIILVISICPCRQRDFELYQNLVQSSSANHGCEEIFVQQARKDVQKKVWFQDKTPLQINVISETSELSFMKQKKEIEVIEEMERVHCLMQEALYYIDDQPMQRIRYLEAGSATHHYNSHHFVAKEAQLWRYEVEGHLLPSEKPTSSPIMHVTANDLEFTLKGEQPGARLTLGGNVHVHFLEGGSLHCDSLTFNDDEKSTLFFGDPQVVYCDEMGECFADRAKLDFTEHQGKFEITKITLFDNVKLVNLGTKERPALQYALADKVILYPKDQHLELESFTGKVLFFDQLRDLQLSARTVYAHREPQTKKESVQGAGDVRFVFGVDELEKIKNRFQIK